MLRERVLFPRHIYETYKKKHQIETQPINTQFHLPNPMREKKMIPLNRLAVE